MKTGERQLEIDRPRSLDLILKQQCPELGSEKPALSYVVTSPAGCKAKGLSLE